MGFLNAFGRILQGKPVFDTGPPANDSQEQPQQFDIRGTQKSVPTVRIERTECSNSGQKMDVRCHIKNDSEQQIYLDKMQLLGATRQLDNPLRPGEAREFLMYSGNRPNNRSNSSAEIDYRDERSDYFQAKCQVEFKQEPDGTYSIHRIISASTMKDI